MAQNYNNTDFRNSAHAQRVWMAELAAAKKELETFHKRGKHIGKAYLDVRSDKDESLHKYNLFNVNTNTLRDALFYRIPKPDVSRYNKDPSDNVGRVACLILQRDLEIELTQQSGFIDNAKNVIKDRLVAGLGCLKVRYQRVYQGQQEKVLTDDTDLEASEESAASEVLKDERVPVDHINWNDVLWSPARVWNEVTWIAFRTFLGKAEYEERFPDSEFEDKEDFRDDDQDNSERTKKEVAVWEIWDKTRMCVYWVREGAAEILDEQEDPYGLPHFFPCPQFLMGDTFTDKYVPVADYVLAQDQYEQLNNIKRRIAALIDQAKARGFYNEDIEELQYILDPSTPEGQMIPVSKWGDLQQQGGLAGAADFVPIEKFVQQIQVLRAEAAALTKDIQDLTGISDIVRGSTSPYETKGAQEMKAGFANNRLQAVQNEVASFFSEAMQIKAFLMCKFYAPERLVSRAGRLMSTDMQFVPQAIQLLKSPMYQELVINVSVDSLQKQNWQQDQQDRSQVVGMVMQSIGQVGPLVKEQPELGPLALQLIKWNLDAFPGATEVSGFVEEQLQQAMQVVQQNKQKQPSEEDKAKQEAQAQQQAEMQAEQQKLMAESEIEKGKAQVQMQIKQMELQAQEQIKAREAALKAAELKLKELELLHQGIDTTEVSLAVGDGNPSMRATKEEVAAMVMQSQQAQAAQTMEVMQGVMTQLTAMMQQLAVGQAQIAALMTEPVPPAEITIRNPDGSVKMKGEIK